MEPKAQAAALVSGGTGGAERALLGAAGGTQEEKYRWHDSTGGTLVYTRTKPGDQKRKSRLRTKAELSTLINTIRTEFSPARATASSLLAELIYNSVTTLFVGEKIMIEMPTFYFPFGAGMNTGHGDVTNHGEPDPMATFRFAEPVIIDRQQNFRVEMRFPQGVPGKDGVPGRLAEVHGPFRIWVVLDGLLTRDVR